METIIPFHRFERKLILRLVDCAYKVEWLAIKPIK